LPDDHLTGAVDDVNLKDGLNYVEADSRDLHRGGSKLVLRDSTTLALRRRSGSHPFHLLQEERPGERDQR
jgi:hypothetical protein